MIWQQFYTIDVNYVDGRWKSTMWLKPKMIRKKASPGTLKAKAWYFQGIVEPCISVSEFSTDIY